MKTVWKTILVLCLALLTAASVAAADMGVEENQKGVITGETIRSAYEYIFLNYDNTTSAAETIHNTYLRDELVEFSHNLARRARPESSRANGTDSAGLYEIAHKYEPECIRCMGEYSYCIVHLTALTHLLYSGAPKKGM